MPVHSNRHGYTMRELLVVVTLICLLLAIIVPAVRISREASRRAYCNSNLKNIGLALQNYHDTYRRFPMGVRHAGLAPGGDPPIEAALGPSWWYAIVPFVESGRLYDRMAATQRAGGPAGTEFTADDMLAAGIPVEWLRSWCDLMRCPSSPLPETEMPTGPIRLPSYVGITGGCDLDPGAFEYQSVREMASDMVLSGAEPLYHNRAKGTGATPGGIITASGMLPPCESVSMADCLDGTSNTMIVAEQSDWLRDRNPKSWQKYRGDAGWTVGGTGAGGGFLSGTRRVDPLPPVAALGGPPAAWGADCWNITTVRYPPNRKRVLGQPPLPGCSENHGINNPLQSPHPGGMHVAMVDGSVQFLANDTDLQVLLRMAIRDDAPRSPADPLASPDD
jgi:prepilin-type processing-associated H-X9-DG protein